jgi:hydroxymethylbilane synthase
VTLRIATRASRLARWQAERIGTLLGGDVEYVLVTTTGDRDQTSELHAIGGQGVFTKEVQAAVLEGRADIAVHSAKDLPPQTPDDLVLAAIPERADPRDALVGAMLASLPQGAVVGTDSVRRRAQLAAARPDLQFGPLRGNIETRLRKREEMGYDAVVVAFAALERLQLESEATELLEPNVVMPQVGQGALAAECRADDSDTRARLRAIDEAEAHVAVTAERAFLAHLGGGCDLPCGALARSRSDGIEIEAVLASIDGKVVVRRRAHGHDAEGLGTTIADEMLRVMAGEVAS